jgi:hypothetical protein
MSLLEKAKVITTPTAYSDGILHSVKPINGDADFDFTRGSSATRVNEAGLIESVAANIPRIDYTDANGALLLEPQRSNYVLLSNDFSALSGGFVTPNYGTSPEGLSVSRILFTSANQSMSAGTPLSTGVVCNFSAYVKGVQGEFIKFAAGGVDIAHTFSGEWERLSGSSTSINNSWNLNTYGFATARDFLMCGAQLEQGSYATSYIPTYGSVQTRLGESCTNAGNTALFESEGVLYAEIAALANDGTSREITISDGSTSNRIILSFDDLNRIRVKYINAATNVFDEFYVTDITEYNKIAIRSREDDFSLWINGTLIATDTSGSILPINTLNRINFDAGDGSLPFYGKTKMVAVFPYLSNDEMECLTSI